MPVTTPVKELQVSMGSTQPQAPPKTIFDLIPLSLVLYLAKPYLAGQTDEAAIELAHRLYEREGYAGTLDILGEDMESAEDCDRSVEQYKQLIDAIARNPVPCKKRRDQLTISMKPSMFSTMAPKPGSESERALEGAFDRITRVVDHALKNEINVTLEAEDHRWTNFQLEAYFALIEAGYTNLGTVLQTRLFRTEKDLERFDERMRVRLVIGIYNEPKQVAHTDKRVMKDLLVDYAGVLLSQGVYVELATHDIRCIDNFYQYVACPKGFPTSQFEHQFLQGVPRSKLQRSLVSGQYFSEMASRGDRPKEELEYLEQAQAAGVPVRMYLPFGTARLSGAYCRRRLRENPNMITYGIKNVLGIK